MANLVSPGTFAYYDEVRQLLIRHNLSDTGSARTVMRFKACRINKTIANPPPIQPRMLAGLTTRKNVGIVANMPAQLIARFKNITTDGALLEVVVWKVPDAVPPTGHGYKYRTVYVVDGIRVVGFDNERGKGDHCQLDGIEVPYNFTGVEQLIEDFIAAVAVRRKT